MQQLAKDEKFSTSKKRNNEQYPLDEQLIPLERVEEYFVTMCSAVWEPTEDERNSSHDLPDDAGAHLHRATGAWAAAEAWRRAADRAVAEWSRIAEDVYLWLAKRKLGWHPAFVEGDRARAVGRFSRVLSGIAGAIHNQRPPTATLEVEFRIRWEDGNGYGSWRESPPTDEFSLRDVVRGSAVIFGRYPTEVAELLADELQQAMQEWERCNFFDHLHHLPSSDSGTLEMRFSWSPPVLEYDASPRPIPSDPPIVAAELTLSQVCPWFDLIYTQSMLRIEKARTTCDDLLLKLLAEACAADASSELWRQLQLHTWSSLGSSSPNDEDKLAAQVIGDLQELTHQPLEVVWRYVTTPLHAVYLLKGSPERRAAAGHYLRAFYAQLR